MDEPVTIPLWALCALAIPAVFILVVLIALLVGAIACAFEKDEDWNY